MLTPLDLIKSYFTLNSYLPWILIASTLVGSFFFIKRKINQYQNTKTTTKNLENTTTKQPLTWKGYLLIFLIFITILGFIYFCFFHQPKEPSSKYANQLIGEIDKAIDKYDETINNYHGLKSDWEKELNKVETELKELYKAKEITQEQKEKIKETLDKNEGKIKELKEQLKDNTGNIAILKGKLLQLEQDKEAKEKEIKQKQEEEKLTSPDDKIRLQAQISKLQDEAIEIVGEIGKIKVQIGKLESTQKSLTEQLKEAERFKNKLIQSRNKLSEKFKELSTIVTTYEQRKAEIQTNIDEVVKKIDELETERDLYVALKTKYTAMAIRMETFDKENELNFGTGCKAAFKAFDKITDLIPAKYGMKILGKTVGVTRKFAQGVTKITLILHEGHRLWHMYNEVINENKETPPMISRASLENYTKDIDRDLARIDADKKDYQKKLEEYQKSNNEVSIKSELTDWENQNEKHGDKIEEEWKNWINEYTKIDDELTHKLKEVSDTDKLYKKHDKLEEQLEQKNDEIETAKAVLKEKNPSYARAQKRYKEKRRPKIPELIPIPNN